MSVRQNGLNPGSVPAMLSGNVLVRAVVLSTYAADEENRPSMGGAYEPKAVTCDVLTYGGRRRSFLTRVPVVQTRHGLNDYLSTWIPRPTTINLATSISPVLTRTGDDVAEDPRDFDGDHVLVQFLENDPMQPVITGALPHPRSNFRQVKGDGEAVRSRHRGTSWEVDQNGNARLDARSANSGDVLVNGVDQPAEDSAHGRVTVLVPKGVTLLVAGEDADGTNRQFELTLLDNEFEVRLNDGDSLKVTGSDDNAIALVGSAGRSVVVAEELATIWAAQQIAINAIAAATAGLAAAFTADTTAGTPPPGAALVAQLPATIIALAALAATLAPPTPHQTWNPGLLNSNKLKMPGN